MGATILEYQKEQDEKEQKEEEYSSIRRSDNPYLFKGIEFFFAITKTGNLQSWENLHKLQACLWNKFELPKNTLVLYIILYLKTSYQQNCIYMCIEICPDNLKMYTTLTLASKYLITLVWVQLFPGLYILYSIVMNYHTSHYKYIQ